METLEEQIARLHERADRPAAPAWMPNKATEGHPTSIAGRVVDSHFRSGIGFKQRGLQIVTIEQPDGTAWAVFCAGTVLEQDLAGVPIGSVVLVNYLGRVQSGENGYEGYRVVVDQAAPAAQPAAAPTASMAAAARVEPESQPEVEEPPLAIDPCSRCGGENGRHAAGCPERASETCGSCGFLGGHHAPNCKDDIPF